MSTILEPAPVSMPTPAPVPAPAPCFRPHRITIDRYHRMVAAGVFGAKDRVFLWKGQLVEKMTKNPPHNIAQTELNAILVRLVPAGWYVAPEQPIVLSDDSQPEPDLSVVRGASRDYPDRPPAARDVALVIEVSDSSLAVDSTEKLEAYAQDAIPIYWLVNLPQRRLEVYRRPEGKRYAEQEFYGPEQEVPLILDGRAVGRIAVRDVLP